MRIRRLMPFWGVGLGFRVGGWGFRVWGWGLGFGVGVWGFRVWGWG